MFARFANKAFKLSLIDAAPHKSVVERFFRSDELLAGGQSGTRHLVKDGGHLCDLGVAELQLFSKIKNMAGARRSVDLSGQRHAPPGACPDRRYVLVRKRCNSARLFAGMG